MSSPIDRRDGALICMTAAPHQIKEVTVICTHFTLGNKKTTMATHCVKRAFVYAFVCARTSVCVRACDSAHIETE